MESFSFHQHGAVFVQNPAAKIQPHTAHISNPKFHRQDIIITRRSLIKQFQTDHRKNRPGLLQIKQRAAKVPEEFAPGRFQHVEITGVINVVAHRAVGIDDALRMFKNRL